MNPRDPAALKEHLKERQRLHRQIKRELDAEEYGTVDDAEIVSLREVLKRPRPAIQYRVQRLQAVGHRVLLAAQFKAGKTTLASNLARSVLDGVPFLGSYATQAIEGTLALLDFEMSPTQLADWYETQRIDHDDRLLVIAMRGLAASFNILNTETRIRWAERFRAENVQYVILDCLRPVFDALGLNEHTDAGLFLTALDALLVEAGIPEALVVHHMGHKGERARGDSRLLDWPDVGWTLVRDEDDPASPRFFRAYGRDVDVPETQLAYDLDTRRLTAVSPDEGGGSRKEAKVTAALHAVCDMVARAPAPPSGREIEKAVMSTGHTQKAIRDAIKKGVAMGALAEEAGRNGGSAYRSTSGQPPDFVLSAAGVGEPVEHM